ncbi:MAG: HD domain-containing phosphohydrolase [Cetobacterium sp.]
MNSKEKSWLKNNKDRVINIDMYNPNSVYFFQKEDGELRGVYVDFFEKITEEIGLKFDIKIKSSNDIGAILRNREGDIVFNSTRTIDRERFYYYVSTLKNNFISKNEIPIWSYWMAVNKKNPELYSILIKYKKKFIADELRKSFKKERPLYYKILLKDDKRLLNLQKKYNFIKVLLPESGDMLPLFYKKNLKYDGYIIDRLKELSFVLDIPLLYTRNSDDDFHIKAVDSNIFLKNSSSQYIPYYKIGVSIFSSIDKNFIDSSKETFNQNVGFIAPNDLNSEKLKGIPKFKNYTIYKTSDSALKAILKGEIDYLYGDFKMLSMAIENSYLSSRIKVSGFFGGNETIGFSLEDNELFEIFKIIFPNQLVETNTLETDLKISRKLNPDYKYFLITSSILLSIIVLLLYLLKKVKTAELKERGIARALVHSFETANELNDEDTGNHILRVNLYSKLLAQKLKCPSDFIREIGEYASLHDVGKIGISDSILKKPGKLTAEEFEQMKLHVVYGHELIQKMELSSIAQNIALYHHERWNGNGYCYGLIGEKIPLEARIVALADVYDALRQTRVYKDGVSHEKAMKIIKEESGEHFDPRIVNQFLEFNKEFEKIFDEY